MVGIYNFEILQGATFIRSMTLKDSDNNIRDLSSYTARMQLKSTKSSSTVIIELTTENGGITLGDSTDNIVWSISDDDTADLDFINAVYDFEIESVTGVVERKLEGSVTLNKNVTIPEE